MTEEVYASGTPQALTAEHVFAAHHVYDLEEAKPAKQAVGSAADVPTLHPRAVVCVTDEE